MPQRSRYTVPYSGKYPHHEHRSKRGRRDYFGKDSTLRYKKKKEKIIVNQFDIDIKIAKIYN